MAERSVVKVWYPESEERLPSHQGSHSFLDYCLKVKPKGELGGREYFPVEKLMSWLGNIMILEYLPDADDFRYRLYGSEIASRSGFDMTGKCVSDFHSVMGDIFRAQYLKAVEERCLIVSRNPYLHSRAPCDWERIICPVTDGKKIQLVVSNYMVDLSGDVVTEQPGSHSYPK